MTAPIYQVDAFTNRPFSGNPAAVCLLEEEADGDWMQAVALEMNLSETAFLRKLDDGYELRWFTPVYEVELCGHATLASAHILWSETELSDGAAIRFHSRSGVLTCQRAGDSIELDFPATPPESAEAPPELVESLGIEQTDFVGVSPFDRFVVVSSEDVVRSLEPDFGRLGKIEMRGVIVTAPSDSAEFDFVSRYFAPAAGVNEDPATGSAHCCLAPYWSERLGKQEMSAFQASARGGRVQVRCNDDRVILGGKAVTTLKGTLSV